MVFGVNNGGTGTIGAVDATTEPSATPATPSAVPVDSGSSIAGGLSPTAPASPSGDSSGADRIKALAQKDKAAGENVIDVLTKPASMTATSVTYKLSGRVLQPGEALYFAIPDGLRERPVNFVILGHRGNPSQDTDQDKSDKWDDSPALSSVQIHGAGIEEDRAWRYWRGSASGSKGAKFAEVGYNVELENLYEWRKYGHGADSDDSSSTQPLHPDGLRVRSMGKDPVEIFEVTLKVSPPKPDETLEAVFSEGTVIGDPETGAGRKYGGGQAYQGLFPGALELGGWGSAGAGEAKLPAGWKVSNGQLEIPLKPGMKLTSIDLACGDSHPDKITNSDGGWGTKGWSRLSMGLQKAGGSVDWFMQSENVPPEGVVSGSPREADYVTKAGDKILIRASSDRTYVMAARVGLRNV